MDEHNNKQSEEKSGHGCLTGILVFFIIVIVCFSVVCAVLNSSNSSSVNSGTGIFERSAKYSDLVVDYSIDISSLGVKFYITPQVDIDDLEMTFKFYDEDKKLLTTIVKTLGDVKESVQVTFTISATDLSFSIIWNMSSVSWTVTDGTVSVFA